MVLFLQYRLPKGIYQREPCWSDFVFNGDPPWFARGGHWKTLATVPSIVCCILPDTTPPAPCWLLIAGLPQVQPYEERADSSVSKRLLPPGWSLVVNPHPWP